MKFEGYKIPYEMVYGFKNANMATAQTFEFKYFHVTASDL
jgi:hypothetical protein